MEEPHNAELEAAIADAPDDPQSYLVYADWLEGHGHPRAALIRAHVAEVDRARPGKKRHAKELLAKHGKLLVGALSRFESALSWRFGFVDRAELSDRSGPIVEHVTTLASHPSARLLSALQLRTRYLDAVIDALVASPPRLLRTLTMSDEHVHRATSAAIAMSALLDALPRLEDLYLWSKLAPGPLAETLPEKLVTLVVGAHDDDPHELRGALPPRLRELSLSGRFALDPLSSTTLERLLLVGAVLPRFDLPAAEEANLDIATDADADAFASATWPRLTKLRLGFHADTTLRIADVERMLARANLPALVELDLSSSPFGDELAAVLCDAPFADKLQVLALDHTRITDDGASDIVRSGAFEALRSLSLAETGVEDLHGLRAARPELIVDHARYDDDAE